MFKINNKDTRQSLFEISLGVIVAPKWVLFSKSTSATVVSSNFTRILKGPLSGLQ